MTPDEIKAWQAQHGGDAGSDPPDANGITVYRAADGSFINVRRDGSLAMRGTAIPAARAAAAAAAPARGGGAMEQQDVEAWIAQQGGPGRVQYARATERVANPALKATLPDGSDNPEYQPGAPPTITVPQESWTAVDAAGKDTGALLHVSRRPDGSFDIIKQANPNPTQRQGGVGPPGGKPYIDEEGPTGRRLGWDPNAYGEGQGGYTRDIGSSPSAQAAAAGASDTKPYEGHPGWSVRTTKSGADTRTVYINPQGQESAAPPPAGQIVPGTTGAGAQFTGIWNPATNEIAWTDNPNAVPPKDQRWIFRRSGDGPPTREKNPYYEKPSKLIQDPQDSRKWLNVTEDDNGNPVILPVTNQTTIKPADLPVLQTKYGEIASGLAALAQDLNAKFARGEITDKERTDAFAAAHGQAETAVSEINSILDNSKAAWSGQVTQRGQTLQDTQGRRSYASDIARSAFSTGQAIAEHSGRGSGAAIAAGVGALLRMGQRYAADMGGFRESPELPLPAALQQAQGIGLPGFGANAAPGGPPAAPSGPGGPPGASAGPGGPAVPPGPLPPPLLPPRPPVTLPPTPPPTAGEPGGPPLQPGRVLGDVGRGAADVPALEGTGPPPPLGQGQDLSTPPPPAGPAPIWQPAGPLPPAPAAPSSYGENGDLPGGLSMLPGMGSALAAGQGYAGAPVAAGGAGVFDPMLEAQAMGGDGADPAWAEAVRRAAQAHAQGSYGRAG